MKRILLILLLALLTVQGRAQIAVVVSDATEVDYQSPSSCTTHRKRTIIINSERALALADFSVLCDDNTSLTSFSCEMSSAQGKKKVKKGELDKSEYSHEMATDSYYYSYSPKPSGYPLQVTYEWTIHETDAILMFEPFMPQEGIEEDVTSASYSVTYPADMTIHHAEYNLDTQVKEETLDNGRKRLSIEVTNLGGIKKQRFMPDMDYILPHAYFVPDTFKFDKTSGSLATWQMFGQWVRDLRQGRDELPDALKQKLHQLTEDCSDSYTKVLKIYRLLEESTRYVSIQLGIGGLQPEAASDVYTHGFGDCKGLSNYMVAMLKEIGIDANYVVIGSHTDIPADFACPFLFNHVIVRANMPDGSHLWIECTNPKMPLGYVHQGIANHEALLITADGGEKIRLPKYSASDNVDSITVKETLVKDGSATFSVEEVQRNSQYEDGADLLYLGSDSQRKMIREDLSLSDFTFTSHSVTQQMRQDRIKDERQAVLVTRYEGKCGKFANVTGSRMFVTLSPYGQTQGISQTDRRTVAVNISDEDYSQVHHIELTIPEGYEVEFLPKAVNETTEFGSLASSLTTEGNRILIDIRTSFNSGIFPAETYQPLCTLINKFHDFTSSKIVLKAKN